MLLLPAVCFGVALAFQLPPEMAVGLMLLSASPGGATANLYSHLSHGDVALNITLTAVNSVLSLLTLPLIVNISLAYFMSENKEIGMQFSKVIQVFAIVLVPTAVGMLINRFAPAFSKKMEKPVKILSALVLLVVIIGAVKANWQLLADQAGVVFLAALTFNLLSLATGYFVPLLFKIEKPRAIAIGMEIGIHNGTLAIFLASTVLQSVTMQIPAAIYSLLMFFTAAGFGILVNRGRK
jgi:BASS family bile acid:Na+ symporter